MRVEIGDSSSSLFTSNAYLRLGSDTWLLANAWCDSCDKRENKHLKELYDILETEWVLRIPHDDFPLKGYRKRPQGITKIESLGC